MEKLLESGVRLLSTVVSTQAVFVILMLFSHPTEANRPRPVTISTLDSMVEWDSTARVIDHFAECPDLGKLGFGKTRPNYEGRPSYDPQYVLNKIYAHIVSVLKYCANSVSLEEFNEDKMRVETCVFN